MIVTNIQRFCLHDGPGIRTTIFFKGCNLRCPWCSNPENLNYEIEEVVYENERIVYGEKYTCEQLYNEIIKDKIYYENEGGITLSGGEAMMQIENIEPLLIKLKKEGINICIETSLISPNKLVELSTKYIDLYYIDLKILDKSKESLINTDVDLYVSNLKSIFNKKKNVIFRIPLVPGYTYTKKNIEEIIKIIKNFKPLKIEIFKIHNLGERKYKALNQKQTEFKKMDDKELNSIADMLIKSGMDVKILKI